MLKSSKEFKKLQRERIMKTKPWLKTKGAITPEGKAKVKMNALKISPKLYELLKQSELLLKAQKELREMVNHKIPSPRCP